MALLDCVNHLQKYLFLAELTFLLRGLEPLFFAIFIFSFPKPNPLGKPIKRPYSHLQAVYLNRLYNVFIHLNHSLSKLSCSLHVCRA